MPRTFVFKIIDTPSENTYIVVSSHHLGDQAIQMDLNANSKPCFAHLEGHAKATHLSQVLKGDDFARDCIAPPACIGKVVSRKPMVLGGLNSFSICLRNYMRKLIRPYPNRVLCLEDLFL